MADEYVDPFPEEEEKPKVPAPTPAEKEARPKGETARQEISKISQGEIQAIVPKNIDETFRMAQAVCAAGLAPDSYDRNPEKVMVGLLKSMEVGFPPLTGLASIAVINGRPCIWGDGAVGLCAAKVASTKVEETGTAPKGDADHTQFPDDYGFKVTFTRKGQTGEYVGVFTVGDAKRAKLWGNLKRQPWIMYPKRMLFNRARAFALRDGFADCLSGLHLREEIEDFPAAPAPETTTEFLDDAPVIDHEETEGEPA